MLLSLVWGAAAVVFISPAYLGVALMSLVIVVGVQLAVYVHLRAKVRAYTYVWCVRLCDCIGSAFTTPAVWHAACGGVQIERKEALRVLQSTGVAAGRAAVLASLQVGNPAAQARV
jgi:hypothetical protein